MIWLELAVLLACIVVGSRLGGIGMGVMGGIGLVVSQWNTAAGWPYRAMQFKGGLRDTTKTVVPPDPINL